MATIVYLHAHPDDEASQTSGTMARAAAEGNRVVTVFATHGEYGEVAAEAIEGESVADHRRREAEASAAVLGVARIVWLGYTDSGMSGWEQNEHEGSFHSADLDEAAQRLADVLDEEHADALVGYDWHGGYGHPDHVKVHHVAHRAAELAASRPRLLESTMNRTELIALLRAGREVGMDTFDFDPEQPMDDGNLLGSTEDEITWRVDVSAYLEQRRASLEAHRSQATDIEFFLTIPPMGFAALFSHEHLIEPGVDGPMREGWPFGDQRSTRAERPASSRATGTRNGEQDT
jgi:LmbE family N-acetylglucosaminyl deacetylase